MHTYTIGTIYGASEQNSKTKILNQKSQGRAARVRRIQSAAPSYTIGIDYGTNSVRALVVRCADGRELGACVAGYVSGKQGVLLDKRDHNLARQYPGDYLSGLEKCVRGALAEARRVKGFDAGRVVGIGVDTTGSSPIPVDERNVPLALGKRFRGDLNAQCWLWKDHTAHREAARITELAAEVRPHFIAKCGNTYSSEWFWAKIWRCLNVAPGVFEAAFSWVELADWIPSVLAGVKNPAEIKRCVCCAGHKAMYAEEWGGLPDKEFLALLNPRLAELRDRLYEKAHDATVAAGNLCGEWAKRLGLPEGIPIAMGEMDVHYGAIGSGVAEGTIVKVIGTSTCDCAVVRPPAAGNPKSQKNSKFQIPNSKGRGEGASHGLEARATLSGAAETRHTGETPVPQNAIRDIPGICGIVRGAILPGYFGVEAGQSAVGDIFKWWVEVVCKGDADLHHALTAEAAALKPGQSGLLALDWNNGNRTVLVDQRLTGLLVGQTLHTTRAEIYRALIEGTAFGARAIVERLREYGVPVERIVCAGGIAEKNPLLMQIYADVLGMPMFLAGSSQACALGAAIGAAVIAGAHGDFATAQRRMTRLKKTVYRPRAAAQKTYTQLYRIYRKLHDAFGGRENCACMGGVMKELLAIKESGR